MDGSRKRNVRDWAIALVVPALLIGWWFNGRVEDARSDAARLAVVCANERRLDEVTTTVLERLNRLSRRFGIPPEPVVIPPRSPECIEEQ